MLCEVMLQSDSDAGRTGPEATNPFPGHAQFNSNENRWEIEIESLSALQELMVELEYGAVTLYFPDPRHESGDLPIIEIDD